MQGDPNPPQPAPSPRRNLMGKAAQVVTLVIANAVKQSWPRDRHVATLLAMTKLSESFGMNLAWRRGEGAGCGLAWDFGVIL